LTGMASRNNRLLAALILRDSATVAPCRSLRIGA
jgi:hypothetical protein